MFQEPFNQTLSDRINAIHNIPTTLCLEQKYSPSLLCPLQSDSLDPDNTDQDLLEKDAILSFATLTAIFLPFLTLLGKLEKGIFSVKRCGVRVVSTYNKHLIFFRLSKTFKTQDDITKLKSDFEIIFCTITEYNILQYRIDFEIVKNTELIIQNSCKILVDIFQESE